MNENSPDLPKETNASLIQKLTGTGFSFAKKCFESLSEMKEDAKEVLKQDSGAESSQSMPTSCEPAVPLKVSGKLGDSEAHFNALATPSAESLSFQNKIPKDEMKGETYGEATQRGRAISLGQKHSWKKALQRIRESGSIYGLALLRGEEILINRLPYSEERSGVVAKIVHDWMLRLHGIGSKDGFVWVNYDVTCLMISSWEDFHLVIFHRDAEDADFIRHICRLFWQDQFSHDGSQHASNSHNKTSLPQKTSFPFRIRRIPSDTTNMVLKPVSSHEILKAAAAVSLLETQRIRVSAPRPPR